MLKIRAFVLSTSIALFFLGNAFAHDDGILLDVDLGAGGEAVLSWAGGSGRYAVTRSLQVDFAYNNTTLDRDTTLFTLTDAEPLSSGEILFFEIADLDGSGNPKGEPRVVIGQGFFPDEPPSITGFSKTTVHHSEPVTIEVVTITGGPFDSLPENNLVEMGPHIMPIDSGTATTLDVKVPLEAFSAFVTVTRLDGQRSNTSPLFIADNDEDFSDISSTTFDQASTDLFVADKALDTIFRMPHNDTLNPTICVDPFPEPMISKVAGGNVFYASGATGNDRNVHFFNAATCAGGVFASVVDGADLGLDVQARGIGAETSTGPVYYLDGTERKMRQVISSGVVNKDYGNVGDPSPFFPQYPAGAHFLPGWQELWLSGENSGSPGNSIIWLIVDFPPDVTFPMYGVGGLVTGFDWNPEETNLRVTTAPDRDVKYAEVPTTRHAYMAASSATTIFHNQDADIFLSPDRSIRALVSRMHGYPYPSTFQTVDREVNALVMSKVGNTTVYLRVVDPPDTAPYAAVAWGDNVDADPEAGALSEDGLSWSKTLAVSMPAPDPDGWSRKTVWLRITDRYAGDNYKIQASFQAFAGTDYNNPGTRVKAESGTITAWKRIYVERDDMFKFGSFVGGTPGMDVISVDDANKFEVNDIVRFIGNTSSGDVDFRQEEHEVIARDTVLDTITLDSGLRYDYFILVPNYLSDAVGVVSSPARGLNYNDLVYRAHPQLIPRAHNEAFVELLLPGGRGIVPNWMVPDEPIEADALAKALGFSHKWFNNRRSHLYLEPSPGNNENIVHLVGFSSWDAHVEIGLNVLGNIIVGPEIHESNVSMVFEDTIEARVGPANLKIANQKVSAHESAHQFQVNANDPDFHCGYFVHFEPSGPTKCIMHRVVDQETNGVAALDAEATSTESTTGIGDIHDVRQEVDPLPF